MELGSGRRRRWKRISRGIHRSCRSLALGRTRERARNQRVWSSVVLDEVPVMLPVSDLSREGPTDDTSMTDIALENTVEVDGQEKDADTGDQC